MTDITHAPTLLFLIGPSPVGKMTVGREVAARTGLRLFHNHASIEPILPFFEFGEPAFHRLVEAFRNRRAGVHRGRQDPVCATGVRRAHEGRASGGGSQSSSDGQSRRTWIRCLSFSSTALFTRTRWPSEVTA
jgi:hypothetical protein